MSKDTCEKTIKCKYMNTGAFLLQNPNSKIKIIKREGHMPKIVHFEIPADDTERAKKFYSELFGWKIEPFENSSEYWLITTEEDDGIGGGMMKRRDPRDRKSTRLNSSHYS